MKLLIVEDEQLLRESLSQDIPWEDHGIEVAGLAANGLAGLGMVRRRRPDIVLLDVRMPHMNGLELIAEIRSCDPEIETIILSGYDNFEFAQKAVELGVSRYLLKPAGEKQILQAVLDAAGQISARQEDKLNRLALQEHWREHLPQLQEQFLQHCFSGMYGSEEMARRARELGMEFPADGAFAAAVLDVDFLSESEMPISTAGMSKLHFSLYAVIRDAIITASVPAHGGGEDGFNTPIAYRLCSDAAGKTIVLFIGSGEDERNEVQNHAHTMLVKWLSLVKASLKLTASAGVSGTANTPEALPRLYRQACDSLQERFVHGSDIVIPYRGEHDLEEYVPSLPLDLERELEISLETAAVTKALTAVQKLWGLLADSARTADELHEHLLYMSGLFVRLIHRQGWSPKQVLQDDYRYIRRLGRLAAKDQVSDWLQRVTRRYVEYSLLKRNSTMNRTVQLLLEIIEQEIDKELSLSLLANRLFMNGSYLSRLFKQHVGKPFSDYVLERRMERSKQLLHDGCKVYDTASLVGFKDDRYFSKVFRKYWGISPSEIKSTR